MLNLRPFSNAICLPSCSATISKSPLTFFSAVTILSLDIKPKGFSLPLVSFTRVPSLSIASVSGLLKAPNNPFLFTLCEGNTVNPFERFLKVPTPPPTALTVGRTSANSIAVTMSPTNLLEAV